MRLRSAITICAVPQASAGPFVFHGSSLTDFSSNLHLAKAIGFDAVELFLPDAIEISALETKSQLNQLSLNLATVGSGAGWVVHQLSLSSSDIDERKKAIDFVKSLIDWSGACTSSSNGAAPVIIGSMQGRVAVGEDRSEVLKRLVDSLNQLSEYAATRYHSYLLYEPLNRYETNLFNRIADAADWLDTHTMTNVLLLADLFHMNIEETDISESIRACNRNAKNWIGHVHWADSNRQAMGFGHTDVTPIAKALESIRYDGYLSGEVFPTPNSEAAARQTLYSIRSTFP